MTFNFPGICLNAGPEWVDLGVPLASPLSNKLSSDTQLPSCGHAQQQGHGPSTSRPLSWPLSPHVTAGGRFRDWQTEPFVWPWGSQRLSGVFTAVVRTAEFASNAEETILKPKGQTGPRSAILHTYTHARTPTRSEGCLFPRWGQRGQMLCFSQSTKESRPSLPRPPNGKNPVLVLHLGTGGQSPRNGLRAAKSAQFGAPVSPRPVSPPLRVSR